MSRKFRFAIAVVAALAGAAPALAQQPAPVPAPAWPEIVTKYVAKVRAEVQTTDMAGYLAAVKNPNGALLLDVREPTEFAAGHVPGAVNIPRGVLEFQIYKHFGYPNTVDTGRKIYVQCQTGGRATLAAASLQKIGFTNVTAVIVNWPDWEKAGNPSEKQSASK
jgi:rhodanese-related sulfurtransferase